MFEYEEFDDEYPHHMAAEKEFADNQFPHEICTMTKHQEKNPLIQKK